jgi:aspartyl-tRNA(Asn)/glutamyl-tRNA(Gln) amidotransferase subunit B
MMEWETVIGLEIHAQLATASKIFSPASTTFGAEANTQACNVDLGLPGVLPVLNKTAVAMAIKFGLAVGAKISPRSVFARKNYFYPDLPKGYQISQFELPVVGIGELSVEVNGETKVIGITRAHLEEDAGKSLHEDFQGMSGIDLNRAGTPLLEIVSEPDMRSPEEAVAYAKKIHSIVRYIDICDGNMQEGSLRFDANISVRPMGQKELGTRAELKNLNSFRFLQKSIEFEVERQIDVIESGGKVVQETRLYDPDKNETRTMRSKEEANDYRYFPDPDLLPLVISEAQIAEIKKQLPELPHEKAQRFQTELGLSEYDAVNLTVDKDLALYFEDMLNTTKEAKLCVNWVMGELSASLNKQTLSVSESPVSAKKLAELINRISDNTISGKIAKQVFEGMWKEQTDADTIIEKQGLKQITDSSAIEGLVQTVIDNNPNQVAEYRAGKTKMMGFFVGQVMKASQGKANPAQVNTLLKDKLA